MYLAFWVVVWIEKADGTLATESANHGLTAIPGALDSLGDVPIETLTTTDGSNNSRTVSYSNNVGFYKMPFFIFAPSSAGVERATAEYESGDVRLGQIKVSEHKPERGQKIEVSALLRTRAKAVSSVNVVFYDGDPTKGGKAFDVERIAHIRARDVYQVGVPFRSNECGDHQIFVTVGKGKPYEVTDSSRIVKVKCTQPPTCATACMRSPQYYLNNLWSGLPRGEVWIAGTPAPVSTRNIYAISQALKGGQSALKSFNRQYVAMQLSMLAADLVGQRRREVLNSMLDCYGAQFAAVELSNGAQISAATTLRELLGQSEWAARAGRRVDLEKLSALLDLLNSDDPNGGCSTNNEVTLTGQSSLPSSKRLDRKNSQR